MPQTAKNAPPDADLVLVDDDQLIRMSWEMVARAKNHRLATFEKPEAFFAAKIKSGVPIYVDYCLGTKDAGLAFAQKLIASGYVKVFLCTGMEVDETDLPQGLSGVVGKEFPRID